MYLKLLTLQCFRNYLEQTVDFSAPKIILVGDNAQGKSNLLEAVELLASLRSHRTSRDRDLVNRGNSLGLIRGLVQSRYGVTELGLMVREKGGRVLRVNQQTVGRQLDFLGHLNAVQFSCLDLELVRGAPELRRNWLDDLLIQLEPVYSHILSQYHHILKQRNALLKQRKNLCSPTGNPADLQLEAWDQQLVLMGTRIFCRRRRGLERLEPLAQAWHQTLSQQQELLAITYQPHLPLTDHSPEAIQAQFGQALEQQRNLELQLGNTLVGPHRDEIAFTLNGTSVRAYGSQGQQRTLVLALKLAELELIEAVTGEPPLLLLDDVLAELDPQRQGRVLAGVSTRFQTLITTTHLSGFHNSWLNSAQLYRVKGGSLETIWRSEWD